MKVLYADCGSTKCDWALVDISENTEAKLFSNTGLNLAIASAERVVQFVDELPAIDGVNHIEFYGAGAGINSANDAALSDALWRKYGASVVVDTDLVGAAKAIFGDKKGIACILGTGSNSGVYNGSNITANTPPLGFILGDEGSGASLGKRLVNAIFKGRLSEELENKFFKMYPISKQELIEKVYRQPGGNFYLAQFTKFLSANLQHPEVQDIVETEFKLFFANNLAQYMGEYSELPLGFVGSIAYYFSDILRKTAVEFNPNLNPDQILIYRSPIKALLP